MTSREVVIATVKMAGQSQPMMKEKRLLCFLAAVALTGCGGGGGGATSSVSPSAPSGSPAPVSTPEASSAINEGLLAGVYSSQFSVAAQSSGFRRAEVYDPRTRSSMVAAFAQATLTTPTASRGGNAYLIASSTFGIAQAARDLLAGIGVANSSYTFLDTASNNASTRSAYQKTSANSIVNILSNPLYTRRGSKLVGGLIISPDDIKKHGWIVSDTGFDGNIDPLAGITGRSWLVKHKADIEHGYRQAVATGKVRLFYGLSADGESRHRSANGCKGFERYCLGTPYSLRVNNAQGRYMDVEGAFVSTYGFAAYVMAWERMAADTPVAKVFELADACAHDLGEAGADADTGLGRLDVGCMANRIYAASVVIEEKETPAVVPPGTVAVKQPVVSPPAEKEVVKEKKVPVTVAVKPAPKVPVLVKPTMVITTENTQTETVPVNHVSTTTTIYLPVVQELLTVAARKKDPLNALSKRFVSLGVTVVTSRKTNAYVIGGYVGTIKYPLSDSMDYTAAIADMYWHQMGHNINDAKAMLSEMGVANENSYTFLDVGKGVSLTNESLYATTPENSMVYFAINPFYIDGEQAKEKFPEQIVLDAGDISDHGWIVSGIGYDIKNNCPSGNYRPNDCVRRAPAWLLASNDWWYHPQETLRKGYSKAIATGKLRLFYALNDDQTKRASQYENAWRTNGCRYFEEYCIGVPYGAVVLDGWVHWGPQIKFDPQAQIVNQSYLAAAYGYGVYLLAWERMPEETHISAIFAMGDRCIEDIGEKGPDTDTGLGRLDIGCIANAVYQTNLHPASATLSVAAKLPLPSKATLALIAGKKPEDHYVLDDPASVAKAFTRLGNLDASSRKEYSYVIGNLYSGHEPLILLNAMNVSYTRLSVQAGGYQESYETTSENSIVYFHYNNPLYLYGPNARNDFFVIDNDYDDDWRRNHLNEAKFQVIKPETIKGHGWIVSGADYRSPRNSLWSANREMGYNSLLWDKYTEYLEKGYRKAVETGKVRLFYALSVDDQGHVRDFLNSWGSNGCKGFEKYCIGVPYLYQINRSWYDSRQGFQGGSSSYVDSYFVAAYGFGVYQTAWERMPANTHISAIFAMGDRCTKDIGEAGPDAATGLGYLDVGCMAKEVYQVNLNPSAATLSVAFVRATVSSGQSQSSEGRESSQAQSASASVEGQANSPDRQQFFDDFAQELFSDLGSLRLPGSTDAVLLMGFPGDSFRGRYRPTNNVQPDYQSYLPQPGYALVGGKLGVMGIGDGELGIFAKIEGIDVSFSYRRSEDFFGGSGSGQFAFDKVGNARLMMRRQFLSAASEHGLLASGWVRQARVTGGQGELLDSLHGREYGASIRYDWQRADGISVSATAWTSRFAGGDVRLAGERFAIGSSDWQWGVRMSGSYDF